MYGSVVPWYRQVVDPSHSLFLAPVTVTDMRDGQMNSCQWQPPGFDNITVVLFNSAIVVLTHLINMSCSIGTFLMGLTIMSLYLKYTKTFKTLTLLWLTGNFLAFI